MNPTPIGLKRGTVEVVAYNPAWPQAFEEEKKLLTAALGRHLLEVEHVGSTAVPGLAAKPIIDMIAAVDSLDDLPSFIQRLEALGYEYMPDRMFRDRKFFPKGPRDSRTHHLNLVIKNDLDQWTSVLLFRDILRSDANVHDQYASLKQTLAAKHQNDRPAYTAAKSAFIQQMLRRK